MSARILAAADVYDALRQPRPHRAAVDAGAAEKVLREEVAPDASTATPPTRCSPPPAIVCVGGQACPAGSRLAEVEVVVHLARGRSNPEIAEALGVSRRTVTSHLEHVYTKLGVSNRTEAALFAMRNGLGRALAG